MYRIGLVEYEPPSDIHECGPQWDNPIQDALSEARGHFLDGTNIIWIHAHYRTKLQELIDQHIWRSPDAAQFAVVLDRAYARAMALPLPVAMAEAV